MSVVGIAVGRLVSLLWVHAVRGGKRGYAPVEPDDETVAEDSEAQKAYEHAGELEAEAPPMYEEAPPYEASDEKKDGQ